MFLDYNLNMTDNLTILLSIVKILLSKYYNNNISLLTKPSIYKDITQDYYGDIKEVYALFDTILIHYIII